MFIGLYCIIILMENCQGGVCLLGSTVLLYWWRTVRVVYVYWSLLYYYIDGELSGWCMFIGLYCIIILMENCQGSVCLLGSTVLLYWWRTVRVVYVYWTLLYYYIDGELSGWCMFIGLYCIIILMENCQGGVCLLDLPEEIIIKIFHSLNPFDIWSTARVCKYLATAATCESLWWV